MSYLKFNGDHLFTGYEMLGSDRVLVSDERGVIQDIIPVAEAGENVQNLKGILSPGLINCHCHLELSHLRSLIPENTGLVDFVFNVVTRRQLDEERIDDAMARAEDEMISGGIVAVGDICNNADSIRQKQKHRISYCNFIEVTGWSPAVAGSRFEHSLSIFQEFGKAFPDDQVSMAPHASYSVSDALWQLIQPYFNKKTTTIHNQETRFEDEFFLAGKGDLLRMYSLMHIDNSFFQPTGKESLPSVLHKLQPAKNVLFVHNTFTTRESVQFLKKEWGSPRKDEDHPQTFICTCPNANLYIENSLPPLDLFVEEGLNMTIGTDSLASNHSLDILAEIKTLLRHFPKIPQVQLLQWATINGASALQMDKTFGSFEPGKTPGIILIEKNKNDRITTQSSIRRLL
jgi:cytosine/adenosine deaminase-related metal-dependent hydrolase